MLYAELVELDNVGHVPQYQAFGQYLVALNGSLRQRSPDCRAATISCD